MTATVIARLERCCHIIEARETTQQGRTDYQLVFQGGRFDGLILNCATKESVERLFDATRDELCNGRVPWWLHPIPLGALR